MICSKCKKIKCEHKNVIYCEVDNRIVCKDCGKTWGENQTTYVYVYQPPITISYEPQYMQWETTNCREHTIELDETSGVVGTITNWHDFGLSN